MDVIKSNEDWGFFPAAMDVMVKTYLTIMEDLTTRKNFLPRKPSTGKGCTLKVLTS